MSPETGTGNDGWTCGFPKPVKIGNQNAGPGTQSTHSFTRHVRAPGNVLRTSATRVRQGSDLESTARAATPPPHVRAPRRPAEQPIVDPEGELSPVVRGLRGCVVRSGVDLAERSSRTPHATSGRQKCHAFLKRHHVELPPSTRTRKKRCDISDRIKPAETPHVCPT